MIYYRYYLTDAGGHIRDFSKIVARTDREALETTWRQVRSNRTRFGFELWQGGRLVYREPNDRVVGAGEPSIEAINDLGGVDL